MYVITQVRMNYNLSQCTKGTLNWWSKYATSFSGAWKSDEIHV